MRIAPLLAVSFLLVLSRGAGADDPAPGTSPPAGRVVAAIAKAAAENWALPADKRLAGDALADAYVRRAAAAAGRDATAFLVGLAHALDPEATLAKSSVTRAAFEGLETPEACAARRKTMGTPTLRGRDDLLLHFFVTAALRAVVGDAPARVAAIAKEFADLNGPSGLSFADLLADEAGISFARWLSEKEGPARLAGLATGFSGDDHMPSPEGFADGVTKEAFLRDYGAVADPRFRAEQQRITYAITEMAQARGRSVAGVKAAAGTWTPVGNGGEFPVSGLAFEAHGAMGAVDYLAVRDHPHPGGLWRVTVATDGAVSTKPLDWPCAKDCPKDAEAISTVPGFAGHYVVVSSEGAWFHLQVAANGTASKVEGGTLDVSAVSSADETSLEGFSLQALGGGMDYVAVWGNRGRGAKQPGLLVWAPATVTASGTNGCKITFGKTAGTETISTPAPLPDDETHRHVSELKLAPTGILWGVATRKPNDPKEFASAVYVLGTIAVRSGTIAFQRAHALAPLWSFEGEKVEALEIAPDGGFLLGADDEKDGGRLLRVPQ